jgi:hypothetical protein
MWTNLFKVDVDGSVIKNCSIRDIRKLRKAQNGLLAEEIRLLKPKTVVFFTGRSYDCDLFESLPEATLASLWSDTPTTEVARVKSLDLPFRSYRTYHPTYLQRSRRWSTIQRLVDQIRSEA